MKTVKELNRNLLTQIGTIESLQSELATFKTDTYLQSNSQNSSEPLTVDGAESGADSGTVEQHAVKLNKA